MQNINDRIRIVFKENIKQLYTFAYRLTHSEKNALRLVKISLTGLRESADTLPKNEDLRTVLFRVLFQNCVDLLPNQFSQNGEEPNEAAEKFYLYKRLEEVHIVDQNEKIDLLSRISADDVEDIFQNLPFTYRSLFLLREIHGFNDSQIEHIVGIDANLIRKRLEVVNGCFQSEIWKKIDRRLRSISYKTLSHVN